MSQEIVLFKSSDSGTRGEGDVVRYSDAARAWRCVAFIAGGFVFGGACVFIPILHLITTWLLPLLGIIFGLRAKRMWARVREARGPCPECGKDMLLVGLAMTDEVLTTACPKCRCMIELRLS